MYKRYTFAEASDTGGDLFYAGAFNSLEDAMNAPSVDADYCWYYGEEVYHNGNRVAYRSAAPNAEWVKE